MIWVEMNDIQESGGSCMYQIAIVEDDGAYAEQLPQYCQRYAREKNVPLQTHHFSDGLQFLDAFRGGMDAVFMDIAMPHMDGMECARRFRQADDATPLMFATTMAQYAIRGYEVNAMDFIVKPVEYDEFTVKMDKILRYLKRYGGHMVTVKQKDEIRVLNARDVTYIEIYNHNLLFHTRTETLQTLGKLSALEEDPAFSHFVRCSQSFLVNCAYITAISQETLTVEGIAIPIARRKRRECMEKIAQVLGRGV